MPSKLKLESTRVVETVAAKATRSELQIEANRQPDETLAGTEGGGPLFGSSPPNMNASLGWPIRTGKSAVFRRAHPKKIGSGLNRCSNSASSQNKWSARQACYRLSKRSPSRHGGDLSAAPIRGHPLAGGAIISAIMRLRSQPF